jgi:hypothetical protein
VSDSEKHLRHVLIRLLESLDCASITFDGVGEDNGVEAALEFDEAYVAACEALGIELPDREGPEPPGEARQTLIRPLLNAIAGTAPDSVS